MRHLKKDLWPFSTSVENTDDREIKEWCKSSLGNKSHTWYLYVDKIKQTVVVAFKEQQDLLSFKLRWNTKHD